MAYVIDSGINPTSGIPANRIREHRNFVPEQTRTDDCFGHGTYVAEVLGGTTYGVAKDVMFVNYRVLDCSNSFTDDSTVAAAIDHMVFDHTSRTGQLAVVNLSLFTHTATSAVIDSAVQRTVGAGITVVTIAGNIIQNSPTPDACNVSPGHLGASSTPNGIITVGGTSSDDRMSLDSKGGPCVDLFAPGTGIPVALLAGGQTLMRSGTSYAAPHVAGVVALHLERKAGSSPQYRTPVENEKDIMTVASQSVLGGLYPGSPNILVYSRWIKRRACCG